MIIKRTCIILCLLCFALVNSATTLAQSAINVNQIFKNAENQYKLMLAEHQSVSSIPFTLKPDGTLKDSDAKWWTSGFFAGSLWLIYQQHHDSFWLQQAEKWTDALKDQQYNTSTHDLGFMLYCSYGMGHKLTGNPAYKEVLMNGAKSLTTRFDPNVGAIKSWDSFRPRNSNKTYYYPVIIDNMMNLELLTWASANSTNRLFLDIAKKHANKTLKNHFRSDNSCYHVVCYSPSGGVLAKKTWQGYDDESAWARGQAWAIYGYTMMYRETKNRAYLNQAQKVALYYLQNPQLPKDKISYWDFNAPNIPDEERDVSAAAVTASALLELAKYSPSHEKFFFKSAETILKNLSNPEYSYQAGEGHGFLLKHSVGFKPMGGEINVPLIYADYYYLEALLRYMGYYNTNHNKSSENSSNH